MRKRNTNKPLLRGEEGVQLNQSGQGEPVLVSAAARLQGKPARLSVLTLLGFKGLKGGTWLCWWGVLSSKDSQHLNSKTAEGQTESKLFCRVFHSVPASSPAFPLPIGRVQAQKRGTAYRNDRSLSTSPASHISLCVSGTSSSISLESRCTHLQSTWVHSLKGWRLSTGSELEEAGANKQKQKYWKANLH